MTISFQHSYKKDFKRYRHNTKALAAIRETLTLLTGGQPLPAKHKEHALIGKYAGYTECHCLPDLLLIYQKTDAELKLARLGSHSELFF